VIAVGTRELNFVRLGQPTLDTSIPIYLHPDRIVHGLEQQPCDVQVVEWVGLVASGFQFFSCLAAEFAEEVGGFGVVCFISSVKWLSILGLDLTQLSHSHPHLFR
jgi:hypothetical protein